jgi:hypothetical protein
MRPFQVRAGSRFVSLQSLDGADFRDGIFAACLSRFFVSRFWLAERATDRPRSTIGTPHAESENGTLGRAWVRLRDTHRSIIPLYRVRPAPRSFLASARRPRIFGSSEGRFPRSCRAAAINLPRDNLDRGLRIRDQRTR